MKAQWIIELNYYIISLLELIFSIINNLYIKCIDDQDIMINIIDDNIQPEVAEYYILRLLSFINYIESANFEKNSF